MLYVRPELVFPIYIFVSWDIRTQTEGTHIPRRRVGCGKFPETPGKRIFLKNALFIFNGIQKI